MGLMFSKIHPGSISDFNITEKNLMWFTGFRKNVKGLSSKIFLVSKIFFKKAMSEKKIQFSETEVAANIDVTPTSIHVQRSGHINNRSMLNEWPIKKLTF